MANLPEDMDFLAFSPGFWLGLEAGSGDCSGQGGVEYFELLEKMDLIELEHRSLG